MDLSYLTDWLELIVRWVHIITGAAWIGASFYFNWLNNNLRPPPEGEERPRGVDGELWSVHGGHFYYVSKYGVAPEKLPKTLHWFKWEAYFTWISGFTLLILIYYLDTGAFLIDGRVRSLLPWQGILIGLGTLFGGLLAYHYACKSPLGRKPVPFAILGFAAATGIGYLLTETFGSRAAYVHMGAMLGTIMAANVFLVIIPNQQKTVGAMSEGKAPDPVWNRDASQRSLHNNYLTLPVLFIMVSNHYPFTYGHEWNWAILAALSLIGAGVRHWFNLRGQGKKNVWILPAAAVAMVALALVSAPKSYAGHPPVAFEEVRSIVERRCVRCHSATPTDSVFTTAPQGIVFDEPAQITRMAARINNQVVVAKTMPLGNMTGITQEERDAIGAWYYQGARGN